MRIKVYFNEVESEIEVVQHGDRLIITRDGQTFAARLIHTDGAHFVLEVEEESPDGFIKRKRIRAAGYRDGDKRQLWANGRMIEYRRLPEGTTAQSDVGPASLSASIPAVVSDILVEIGDAVKKGDKLILLESMKMILTIQAPYDGTVQAVFCAQGEAVQPGIQLLEIEP
jgi:biotin carboxyl carrier protein